MKPSTLLTLLSTHAKAATVAVVAAGATAGGGLAVATTVADSHAANGLATAHSAQLAGSDSPDASATESPETDQSSDSPDATDSSDSKDVSVTPVDCPSGFKNHGAYVSSIAKTKPTPGSSPGAHGAAVSAAAQSDVCKPSPQPSSSESESETPHAHPSHPAAPADKGKPSTHPTNHGHH